MKKILLFCISLIFVACNDDDFFNDEAKPVPETPPTGLKLKQKNEDTNVYQYFYHKSGFIDSIYVKEQLEISHKFFYNELNQVVEDHYIAKHATNSTYDSEKITKYIYNRLNQIVKANVYDKNNKLTEVKIYKYNADGSLYNPTKIVEDENLTASNSSGNYITYKFDSTRNPYYNIYPKAYRIINYVNKNNITFFENKMVNTTAQITYELSYNAKNYISTQLKNGAWSNNEYTQFHYY